MFGIRKALSGPDGAPDPDDSLRLSDLVSSIASSIFASTHPLRTQHIDATAEYFEPASQEEGAPPGLKPKTLALHIPRPVVHGDDRESPSAVPLASLVQTNPIVLDEASLEMNCRISGFDAPEDDGAPQMRVSLAPEGLGAPVRISLKYKQASPPEGVARIHDSLVRGL